jgi:hypothetical protein
MFGFKPRQFTDSNMPLPRIPLIEPLEDRQLLSATVHHAHTDTPHVAKAEKAVHAAKTHTKAAKTHKKSEDSDTSGSTTTDSSGSGVSLPVFPFPGKVEDTITFSQAPSAVQTGLTTLASTDGQAAPTSTQTVYLGNTNGVETYTLHDNTTGTSTSITVDQNGNPVTKPTDSTTTFGDLSSSDSAAATEISAIATALNLTAPTDTTTINVSTTSAGAVTYSVHLSSTSSTAMPVAASTPALSGIDPGGPMIPVGGFGGDLISVDASGNPVGNQRLPFSVLPAGIQSAINSNVPSGATALSSSSTQIVRVETIDGVTLYTTTFDSTGTTSTITVNSTGTLVSLPSQTTADFSTIPQTAQNELQTLATADGVTTTISATQTVDVYTEANGTVIYSVSLSTASSTTSSSSSFGNFGDTITIAVDAAGNPTVPSGGGFGGGYGGGGGWGGGGGGPIPVAFA